jgi:AcrR family transcriptional regulator
MTDQSHQQTKINMPKQTFFNLPENKRQTLLDLAIEEFSSHSYKTASISRLVAQAGIAKGSFYQYFEDKQDLYNYLLELATQEKAKIFATLSPPEAHQGIFAYMNWMFEAGVRFEFLSPRLSKIGYRAVNDNAIPPDLLKQARGGARLFFQQLVQQGVAQGELDPDLDVDLAGFVFNAVLQSLGDYLMQRLNITPEALVKQEPFPLDTAETRQLFAQLMQILERGMGKK